ncbi:hypothetical protein MJL33_31805, partial [Salmonella enterica subsp. enterica serovar Kentucky]|nr:hypothetical protein [Salmonella enterica subsp. enterica serovar Kentucky]
LVLGGLIGGPVARYLVKHSTTPDGMPDDQAVPTAFEKPDVGRLLRTVGERIAPVDGVTAVVAHHRLHLGVQHVAGPGVDFARSL